MHLFQRAFVIDTDFDCKVSLCDLLKRRCYSELITFLADVNPFLEIRSRYLFIYYKEKYRNSKQKQTRLLPSWIQIR